MQLCKTCNKEFKNRRALHNHQASHKETPGDSNRPSKKLKSLNPTVLQQIQQITHTSVSDRLKRLEENSNDGRLGNKSNIPEGSGDGSAQDHSLLENDLLPVEEGFGPSTDPVNSEGLTKRRRRLPARLLDFVPHSDGRLLALSNENRIESLAPDQISFVPPQEPATHETHFALPLRLVFRGFRTESNVYGVHREYLREPTQPRHAPPSVQSTSTVTSTFQTGPEGCPQSLSEALGPFPSYSAFLLSNWYWSQETGLSDNHLRTLTHDIFSDPLFRKEEVSGIELSRLKSAVSSYQRIPLSEHKGWQESKAMINVPLSGLGLDDSHPASIEYEVPGMHSRSIVDLYTNIISTDTKSSFIWIPYKEYHTRNGETERLYSELYTCDAFIEEFHCLQRSAREPDCTAERVILGLMFWSDATLLANFGSAKLWPIYMAIGNQSKYLRACPSADAMHDVAYLPSLPSSFQDYIQAACGRIATPALKTFCRRELMHACWSHILDEQFCEAYRHGTVITFLDGSSRRVYPRIFTYSADYPEKVLLATIKDGGICCCPRCLTKKDEIQYLGLDRDTHNREQRARTFDSAWEYDVRRSRELIFKKGYGINSNMVERILKPKSLVPVENSFQMKLGGMGFSIVDSLVSDVLHETELGEIKTLLAHLIRMLYSRSAGFVSEMNKRFRAVPQFSTDTIRKIKDDVSEMKQLAARDYEDFLQVCIPVFEGLFHPGDDQFIQRLLFVLLDWHALAKLRMHTESSIEMLRRATIELGIYFRYFANKIAVKYDTYETSKEQERRGRQLSRSAAANASVSTVTRNRRNFNLSRYKFHALGGYVSDIRMYGPTDSYSTRLGETNHRRKKRQYRKTNKRGFEKQISSQTTLQENLRFINQRVKDFLDGQNHGIEVADASRNDCVENPHQLEPETSHESADKSSVDRYKISKYPRTSINLSQFVQLHSQDPSIKLFRAQLLDHVLSRLQNETYSWDDLLHTDYSNVIIHREQIHVHNSLRITYSTYDCRRSNDHIKPWLSINQSSVSNNEGHSSTVLLSAVEDGDDSTETHEFWYAQVLGIFSIKCKLRSDGGAEYTRLDSIWVRWLGRDLTYKSGQKKKRLHRVGYVPNSDSPGAFGFVDPKDIIRGVHLIPAFAHGRNSSLLNPSFVKAESDDWAYFYVNSAVDRDMFMRFRGGGVGHFDPKTTEVDGVEGTEDVDESDGDELSTGQEVDDDDNDSQNSNEHTSSEEEEEFESELEENDTDSGSEMESANEDDEFSDEFSAEDNEL